MTPGAAGPPPALAFDLGASGGRAVAGRLTGGGSGRRLVVEEVGRFPNDPVRARDRLHWDILRLLHEVKGGLAAARRAYGGLASVGLDSWAVDFGLLGRHGELLGNPYHYRDPHTTGAMERVWAVAPRAEVFARTGIQMLPFNTLYQLHALKAADSPLLDAAESLLMIPDLLRYFLTGERHGERTNASTTQCFSPFTNDWDRDLLGRLGLPGDLFVPAVAPGTPAGALLPSVREETGLGAVPVVAVAEHDTASAVAAAPATDADRPFAYLSCGTWSLIGTEVAAPVITERALAENVTNEIGAGGTFRLLKNMTGLWIVQECRRAWAREGQSRSHEDDLALAAAAPPFAAAIDPDDPAFVNPPDMPRAIREFCRRTGQAAPGNDGAVLRCALESLALKHRAVLERIEGLVGTRFAGLHLVGGGARNGLLCQWTADALGRPVWAGPEEATAIGNLLLQLLALGQLADLGEGRRLVAASFPPATYHPADPDAWGRAYERFQQVIGQRP